MHNANTSSEQEQALAVFNHAAEEIRFFKGQQWQVTNYALLTFAALAAIPLWWGPARWALFGKNGICAGVAIVAAAWAFQILRSLDRAIDKERDRMNKARSKLPLIQEFHAEPGPRDRKVSSILHAAVFAGAFFAFVINVLRIPRVLAWFTAGP
jgi:hypothetical protein